MSIGREETLGPQDARGIGVKLCGADGPVAEGGGWPRGAAAPLPAARPPPPSLVALARHRLGPSPLPPPSRSPLARSLAGSSSLARPRPAQLGQSDRGAERASARGAQAAARARGPLPRRACPARSPPPGFPAPAPSACPQPAARGPAPPAATMPAARRPAAGLGGTSLLLALLLWSPAAALAGGKRPEGRGGGGGKVAASAGQQGVAAHPGDSSTSGWVGERGRPPKFGAGNRVPSARADGSVEAGMCLKDSDSSLLRLRAPFRSARLWG